MTDALSRKSDADTGAARLHSIANWVCFVFGFACLALGVGRLWQSNIPGASLGLGAGLLLIFAATVDRFELLKGLGIEAKTRQIDAKLAQADEALERIRELSELTGANLVFLHSKLGQWHEPSVAEAHAVAEEVKANLTGLGSSPAKIKEALDPWVRRTCGDILWGLAMPLAKRVQHRLTSVELARAAALVATNAEDPESLRLREEHASAMRFIRRLESVRSLELQTLPGGFLKLYDEAPLVAKADLAELRAEAENFMPMVLRVRDEQTMPDPERWCPAIDQLLERAVNDD